MPWQRQILLLSLFFLMGSVLSCSGLLFGCTEKQNPTRSSPEAASVGTTEAAGRAPTGERAPGEVLAEVEVDTPTVVQIEGDVPFVETPEVVVDSMLALADVSSGDVVYDLGSGDGRIVIAAAKKYGAQGVGIELRSDLVKEARQRAREAGVADLVEFREGDLFKADISDATVVTLYLLPNVNLKLRSKLVRELRPGTRVVSHNYGMGAWSPNEKTEVDESTLYLWRIPGETPAFLK